MPGSYQKIRGFAGKSHGLKNAPENKIPKSGRPPGLAGLDLGGLERATRRNPKDPVAWVMLAKREHALGKIDVAISHLHRAFELCPAKLDICLLLADLLCDQHRYREASAVLDRLESSVEKDKIWYLMKGRSQSGALDFEKAVHFYHKAAQLAPEDRKVQIAAFSGMGPCFTKIGMHSEAAICFRSLLDWNEYDLGAAIAAAHASSWACDWSALGEDFSRLAMCIERCSSYEERIFLHSVNSFPMITLTDDPAVQLWTSRMTARQCFSDVTVYPWRPDAVRRFDGRIRIGLMSADFHRHATMILAIEALESINRDIFELWVYSGGPDDGSALRSRIKKVASGWRETADMSSDALSESIKSDGIGILVEMKGYTMGSRISVLASRPAPIQVSWLGYPGTTGAPCIDYFIGDRFVTPLSHNDDFSECIAQMPFCYQPNDSLRASGLQDQRHDVGLPAEGIFVFASFNQQYKIVPEVFQAWCQILKSVPNSVLWLLVRHEESQKNLRIVANEYGISEDRIIFAPFVHIDRHRRRLPLADLCLDTFPCGGHTTASDALWAGVPVLALTGHSFASRVASSLLHTLGLPELVCTDIDQYIAAAVRLATEPGACADLRQRLARARVESPLFDGRRFARDFERLLLRMVERQDAGLPPAPLAAELS
ncbi:MAG: hypothetical protein RLZZ592_371 [Pseudomonadota bacterium]|jgi:predicted O-linked N-acetylglucosamine transferase (SPINDLY family)